ncbi:mucin-binding protein [Lactobacillus gasseri]|nr:LPXTG cell wall anchor domain-containing protein [Lactobacillus gasseri]
MSTPTRTIVVTDPSGKQTRVTQTVNFTRTATFDEVTGEITYSDWKNSEPAEWQAYAAPEVAGYTATSSVSAKSVTAETKNETVNISYTANTQTGKITYVDSDGKEVGQTAISGKTGETVKVTPEVPSGWRIVLGQDIPETVTMGANGGPTVVVKVTHSTITVTPETPEKDIPTGPVPGDPSKNYEKLGSLTSTPTRTIVVTDPSGKQTKVTQTVNFTRTATFDEVTGEITYSDWTSSEPAEWSEYTAPEVAGYTATSNVSVKPVTAETKNETVNISYTANTQTGKITYVDGDGKEVGQTTISGKTGETVKVTPEVPSGWRIVPGQDIPETITATATGVPTVVVKVERSTITVTPETPEKDIPTGPVPGDPSKNYEKLGSLTSTPTRTIVVTDPSGKQTTVTQTVNFTRTATFDEVTGEITYSDWTSSEPAEWQAYTAPEVAGYTATSNVSAKPVTAETKNETVNISYTANTQTGKITYVDGDGKEVGQTTISGKTGETVKVTPEVPSGWRIVPGQDIPETITATATGVPTVVVKVERSTITVTPETPEKDIPTGSVPGDPSKNYEKLASLTSTPTRTIVVTDPSGKQTRVTQTVNFTRTATFDEVTGGITYSDWKLQKSNAASHVAQWDSYTPQVITHYVPSVAEVPAKVVNAHTANSQVEITYAPASESQVIRYVDQNGKEISTQIVPGKYGVDTTFTPKLPNNWQAANTIPTSIKIGENGGLTTIVVEAKTEKVQQAKTVTETIHYHTANGKQLFADKEMEVNFFRTGVKNLVTGEITWNNWNKDKESFNEVPSPKVSGYMASPTKVAVQTVTPNSEDLVFNVIYTKNSQTHPTIPENKPNKPQEENVSKQETKTQDKLIHEYGYKKRADGRLVDHTGHVYPASSKVKENGAIYSEKGELLSVGSRRKHELPQTGLHDNSLIAAIGSLLAGISIFGLLGGRKKKDDDK